MSTTAAPPTDGHEHDEERQRLARIEVAAAESSLKAYAEKESHPHVEFYVGAYLDESYKCASVQAKEDEFASLLFRAIHLADVRVVDIAIWILVNHKVKRVGYKQTNDGRTKVYYDAAGDEVELAKAPLLSLKDVLANHLEASYQLKIGKSSEAETFVKHHKGPCLKMLTIALSLFLAGYGARGRESKKNQDQDFRWVNNIRGIASFLDRLPLWVSVTFLSSYRLTPSQSRIVAAIAAFLSASTLVQEMPGGVTYGIVRPLSNLYMPIYRRVVEFEKRFPGKLIHDAALLSMTYLGAAIEASIKLGAEIVAARKLGAEVEVWVSRVIFPGMFPYLGELDVRKGQTSMLFAVCEDDDVKGRDTWREFITNPWASDSVDITELMTVKAWVKEVKAERIREIEVLTGLTLEPLGDDILMKKKDTTTATKSPAFLSKGPQKVVGAIGEDGAPKPARKGLW